MVVRPLISYYYSFPFFFKKIPVRSDVPNRGNNAKGTPVFGMDVGTLDPV
jgi:hypothetical protein